MEPPSPDPVKAPEGLARLVVRRVLLNLVAAALVTGAGEAAVRAWREATGKEAAVLQPSSEPGARFRWVAPHLGPDGRPEFDQWIVNNRYGFHGPDHPPRRSPGTRRVAILGDSFMEARQVPVDRTLAARLEELLPRTEVLGFGHHAYSTIHQEKALRDLPRLLDDGVGPDLPDVVVFQCHGPFAVRQALGDEVGRLALWRRAASYALYSVPTRLRVLEMARASLLGRIQEPRQEILLESRRLLEKGRRSAVAEEAWKVLGAAGMKLARNARAQGSIPVFMYLPTKEELQPETALRDPGYPTRRFETLVRGTGAAWVDLTPAFRDAGSQGEDRLHFAVDSHLTERGHEVAAEALAAALRPILEER